jgi:thiol-disulfide isomerase/thioredoxin
MFVRNLTIAIGIALMAGSLSSCSDANAGNLKSDAQSWIKNLLTPRQTTLEKAESGYMLKGNLKNKPFNLLMLWEMDPNAGQIFLDSARTDKNGNFEIRGNAKEPLFCQLQWDESSAIYLIVDNKTSGTLQIEPNDGTYSVEGKSAEGIIEMKELLDLNSDFMNKMEQLKARAANIPQTPEGYSQGMALQAEYNKLITQRVSKIRELALSKPKSLLPAFIITYGVIEGVDVELMQHAIKSGKARYPNSKYVKPLELQYEQEKRLGIGAIAPEIKLPQPNGDTLSLSSLRGQVVLIDFWASWCGPCRRENPFNTQLYKQYHPKGFEILGVSLDDDKGRWKGAIASDSLVWKHVSDLRKWSSMVVPLYKVEAIPATYLIDKDGKIVAKGLRGEALAAKLEELFDTP